MHDNAKVLLDALLAEREEEQQQQDGEPTGDDSLFELFCFEQGLKEYDLSEEELLAGQVGGGDDGGVDGVYCFLNGSLLEEDADLLDEAFDPRKIKAGPELSLVAIQAKRTASFTETAVQRIAATLHEILDLSKSEEELGELLSEDVVARVEIFRTAWARLAPRHPVISVSVIYATKGGVGKMNSKVRGRAKRLEADVTKDIHGSSCRLDFLGARELLDLAAQEKSYTLELTFQEMATAPNSHLLLVGLEDYYKFIAEEGKLRKHIFDWNVRDYEGDVEVNKEITASLESADDPEFWWLNNGVTIICSRASTVERTLSLDDVQVVNGLQTSVSISNHLSTASSSDPARSRSVLVRVIVTDDADTRAKVNRATNRQTAVQLASLRATDSIQRDIERYFLSKDWYYERRKNYYRNQDKPGSRIVTIPYLAQAVLAIGFSEPSNSRARPSSLLKKDDDYNRIFDESVDYALFLWLAEVQKSVDRYLRSVKFAAASQTNLRFHASMVLVAVKQKERTFHPKQLLSLVGTEFKDGEVFSALDKVIDALGSFIDEGHPNRVDKAVKNSEFTEHLLEKLFP